MKEMNLDDLKQEVTQIIQTEEENTIKGIKQVLAKEYPSDTRFLLFDLETDGEYLSITVHSAISVSNIHNYPEPGIAGVDLTGDLGLDELDLDEEDVDELEDELIEFGRKYYVEWLAKCFDKAGGGSYPLPCVARLEDDFYHLQKGQWIEPEEI
ncbi:hypothetical protein [Salinithrix halophila]|uniref:Uncharacterized protein n=1 Tax=Salinithrix halophila TaxID=1485204 RepID=A0ABV8JD48_9BACL